MRTCPVVKNRRWLALLVVLVTLSSAIVLGANATTATSVDTPQPLWEIDLSKFGYEPRPPEPREEDAHHYFHWATRQGLGFTQENTLVVTFETHPESSELSTRGKTLPTDPYHLVALFLNAKDGTVIRQGDWPVRTTDRTFFFPALNGHFVLGVGTTLFLYSPDLKIAAQRTLPASWGNLMFVVASPVGDTLLAHYTSDAESGYASTLNLIDSTNLATVKSWTGDQAWPAWSLWGNELARFPKAGNIQIETITAPPRDVPSSVPAECHRGTFVNQVTLAVSTYARNGCNNLALISTEGKFIYALQIEAKGLVGLPWASNNGQYFLVESLASQRPPWKIFVNVFELGNEKPIMVVTPPLGPSDGFWGGGLGFAGYPANPRAALSPNGDFLAIRFGSIVRVYKVPHSPGR